MMIDDPDLEERVILVNSGGDGSLMRTIKDFHEDGIDINELFYVTFPFGTANDLPRAFGWGKVPPRPMLRDMNWVMEQLLDAEED